MTMTKFNVIMAIIGKLRLDPKDQRALQIALNLKQLNI